MSRNVTLAVVDPDGTERATHRLPYGARLRVNEGDVVKRGQRMAEWDPYTRPIITEVDGFAELEDLVEGQSVAETQDESTGITKRVVTDWRTSQRAADLRPAIAIKDKERQDPQARPWRRGALSARDRRHLVGRPGCPGLCRRRHRPYPDRERQDPRHHRRSAAGGGTVRSAASEGGGGHRRNLRHHPLRPRLQEQAPHLDRACRARMSSPSNI